MFDEFVREARRLFSSKSNGGKQVSSLTDRLHTQKLVLLALAIVLLLGYSQFREHFKCQGVDGIDERVITNFCLINGTTTTEFNRNDSWPLEEQSSRVSVRLDGGNMARGATEWRRAQRRTHY
jgi:hypothetical protein